MPNKKRWTGGESCCLLLGRAWREVLEHFVHAFIQILDVLVGVVGKSVAGGTSPHQLLRLGVEEIDDHGADLVGFSRGRCLTKTSTTKAPPAPTSTHPLIESIECLLIAGDLDGYYGNIAAGIHLGPAFCSQSNIDGILDAIHIQRIFRLNVFPRVGLVLSEVCAAIEVGLDLLCRCRRCKYS